MTNGKLDVAVVGLRFGGAFVPIWLDHPMVNSVGVCDLDSDRVKGFTDWLPALKVYRNLDEILADDSIDAVHLVTGIPDHAEQTIAVLNAGKHCACAVPMATSLEDIQAIFDAVHRSGKNYMMMETTLYTYEYFYIRQMLDNGDLGRIQFLRGSHYQDMENWPAYWNGLPPFWYGTHALSPMITLSGSRVDRVSCLGSGTMREELVKNYGNPFPVESVLLHFENGLAGESTRTLFETARQYQEGLFVYGSKKTFEWGFQDADDPTITTLHPDVQNGRRGLVTTSETVAMPNYYADLPEELWKYTVGKSYDATNPQESLRMGNAGTGHHGSHSHLVNEFVNSIIEGRKPWVDEVLAANITSSGICAHESALRGGEWITVPEFK